MNKEIGEKFMTLFNNLMNEKLGTHFENVLQGQASGDEMDLINQQKEQDLFTKLNKRNVLFMKKVEEAKNKILDGTYGLCEDCGCQISESRLLARPTATLCISCKEEEEKIENGIFKNSREFGLIRGEGMTTPHNLEIPKLSNISEIEFESVIDM